MNYQTDWLGVIIYGALGLIVATFTVAFVLGSVGVL